MIDTHSLQARQQLPVFPTFVCIFHLTSAVYRREEETDLFQLTSACPIL